MSTVFNKKDTFADSIKDGKPSKAALNGVVGTASLFNKFSRFRYHKFGISKTAYDPSLHFDLAIKSKKPPAFGLDIDKVLLGIQEINDNPTASNIIRHSKQPNAAFGPAPYSITDFIYCKNYGLIPNNRLVTLRRFPMPVQDNMKGNGKTDLVPLAQAVTWFGADTKNTLNNVIPHLSWDMPWKPLDAQDGQQDTVSMENVSSKELLDMINGIGVGNVKASTLLKSTLGKGLVNIASILQVAGASTDANNNKLADANGSLQKNKEFNENLYNQTGPKWNEIYGGTNYVTQTYIRDSMNKANSWFSAKADIKFHYSLKSYAGIKPKIAMLDIISNFLQLTYLNLEWKGSFSRFLPTAGVTGYPGIDAEITRLYYANKPVEATKLAAAVVALQMAAGAQAIGNLVFDEKEVIERVATDRGGDIVATDINGKKFTLENLTAAAAGNVQGYKNIAKKPFSMRAKLSGEAIGEWHLVVGNPLQPIATIGNLICTGCTMEFGDELGPDDFPSEIIFTVSLKPGQPRDKFAIENMFNLGGGSLTEFSANPPASNFNSAVNAPKNKENTKGVANGVLKDKSANQGNAITIPNGQIDSDLYITAKKRISASYGAQYGNLNSLPVYFMTDSAVEKSFVDQIVPLSKGPSIKSVSLPPVKPL